MPDLTIGHTIIGGDIDPNDYAVKEDGYGCGRIRLGFLAGNKPVWQWSVNPPLPVPSEFNGNADTLDEAKEAFKSAWARYRATLTPERVAHWHELEDSVRERFG